MVRKIVEKVPDKLVQQDLEKYRQKAIELGATDAKIITTDMIVIDERVRAKCMWPRCGGYGTSANCPPHTMELDEVRKLVSRFQYGIFVRLQVPSEEIAGPEAKKKRLFVHRNTKLHEIVSKIEAEAFFDGYHLALAFACGSCKVFCLDLDCAALVPGQSCRHHLRARPSMEAVGMDVFTMSTKVGWDIYPIGSSLPPSEVPWGAKLGLVLIN